MKKLTVNYLKKMFKAAGLKDICITGEEGDTIVFNGYITMRPDTITRTWKTLRGPKSEKMPGWVVEVIKDIPSTRENPPDVDIIEAGEYQFVFEAIKKCLMIIKEVEVDGVVEDMRDYDPIREAFLTYYNKYTKKQQDMFGEILRKHMVSLNDMSTEPHRPALAVIRKPLDKMPLYINDKNKVKMCTAIWRLKVGK